MTFITVLAIGSALALGLALTALAADSQPGPSTQAATGPGTGPAATLPACVQSYLPRTYTSGRGKTLRYRLFVPKAALEANPKGRFPLVVYLHGSGGSGDDNTGQLTDGRPTAAQVLAADAAQKKYPCFILAPQCPKKETWGGIKFTGKQTFVVTDQSSEPLDLTLELLSTLVKTYPVDPSRLYITGNSLGGFGTWRAIAKAPDTFAAAIVVCGLADEAVVPVLAPSKIPVWVFHGEKDPVVSPELVRHLVKALEEAHANVKYTEYPNGSHKIWSKAYSEPELLAWLFGHKNASVR